ncbi:MAG: hypothetical protein ACXAEI_18310 [Candidatus Hodarchaeales archaeon]|jgi:hypothetical protein
MNKRQKAILAEFLAVMLITAVAVLAMINFKDWVNRSEAIRAMESLSKKILEYRQTHGSVPPKSWVDEQTERLPGYVRLGDLQYRGLWIDFESTPDEILAYAERNYKSLLVEKGYVVLRLDGRVEWLGKQEFETLLARQQSQSEIQMLHGNQGFKAR